MASMRQDPFGDDRTLRNRWFAFWLGVMITISRRRVWICVCVVIGALAILGVITGSEDVVA